MNRIPLESVYVARPCSAEWNSMTGDERIRFCHACKLNVYNLSEMTKREAEDLILEKEGKLCIRYYKRFDSTILTKDCPFGRLVRYTTSRYYTLIAWVLLVCITAAEFAISAPALKKRLDEELSKVVKQLEATSGGAAAVR